MQSLIDAAAFPILAPLGGDYLPWGGAAMRPGGVAVILNDIVVHRRRTVVECGSGISTLWIGRLLKRQGGLLTSIEHDGAWAETVRRLVAAEELEEHVRIVDAPLTPFDGATGWYDRAALEPLLAWPAIELLVVDGPPSSIGPAARYPALPVFGPALASDATIVLDDVNRSEERRILARWERESGLRFERRRAIRIAVANTGGSYVL